MANILRVSAETNTPNGVSKKTFDGNISSINRFQKDLTLSNSSQENMKKDINSLFQQVNDEIDSILRFARSHSPIQTTFEAKNERDSNLDFLSDREIPKIDERDIFKTNKVGDLTDFKRSVDEFERIKKHRFLRDQKCDYLSEKNAYQLDSDFPLQMIDLEDEVTDSDEDIVPRQFTKKYYPVKKEWTDDFTSTSDFAAELLPEMERTSAISNPFVESRNYGLKNTDGSKKFDDDSVAGLLTKQINLEKLNPESEFSSVKERKQRNAQRATLYKNYKDSLNAKPRDENASVLSPLGQTKFSFTKFPTSTIFKKRDSASSDTTLLSFFKQKRALTEEVKDWAADTQNELIIKKPTKKLTIKKLHVPPANIPDSAIAVDKEVKHADLSQATSNVFNSSQQKANISQKKVVANDEVFTPTEIKDQSRSETWPLNVKSPSDNQTLDHKEVKETIISQPSVSEKAEPANLVSENVSPVISVNKVSNEKTVEKVVAVDNKQPDNSRISFTQQSIFEKKSNVIPEISVKENVPNKDDFSTTVSVPKHNEVPPSPILSSEPVEEKTSPTQIKESIPPQSEILMAANEQPASSDDSSHEVVPEVVGEQKENAVQHTYSTSEETTISASAPEYVEVPTPPQNEVPTVASEQPESYVSQNPEVEQEAVVSEQAGNEDQQEYLVSEETTELPSVPEYIEEPTHLQNEVPTVAIEQPESYVSQNPEVEQEAAGEQFEGEVEQEEVGEQSESYDNESSEVEQEAADEQFENEDEQEYAADEEMEEPEPVAEDKSWEDNVIGEFEFNEEEELEKLTGKAGKKKKKWWKKK